LAKLVTNNYAPEGTTKRPGVHAKSKSSKLKSSKNYRKAYKGQGR
tara:strand:+ start:228 stop:362 length:135 start_codon:yes stop_codon:yes gene_type:complete